MKRVARLKTILITMVCFIAVAACNKVPDYVIRPDDMAELLADIHIGESFVESNYQDFPSDSMRMLMKQSVIYHHGYTMEQVDTSFMWYGAHLDTYQEVYDKAIAIIERRISEDNSSRSVKLKMETDVDSANVWTGASRYQLSTLSPSRYIVFDIPVGNERAKGEMYTLRAHFTNLPSLARWIIQATYDDGSLEILQTRFSGDGKHEMTFCTDSLKNATRIYGSVELDMTNAQGTAIVDSISLIRKPLIPRLYSQRYRQRTIKYFK